MKIAVIGAGFTGLAAAYRLVEKGHSVTVFEKDSQPGGLAIGYQEKGWEWTLEAFYHHWFTNDEAVLSLAKELGFPVIIKRPKTSHLIEGKIYHLDSPLTLLGFKNLSLRERLQMGVVLAFLRYNPFWKPLEKLTAAGFLSRTIGRRAYKTLWEPLLVGKFGEYTDQISLAWFWARIVKRTTNLAYPEGGFLRFAKHLAKAITDRGGKIQYGASVEQITEKKGRVSLGKLGTFDKVIVTLPSFAFLKIAPQLPEQYKRSLMQLKGLGAIVLVMRLREPFLSDNTYWLSICDTKAPLLALVEHTNLMDRKFYHNEHLVYLGNYLPQAHRYFSMSAEELLKTFDPFLKKINPDYKKSLIGVRKFSVPFAQPIIPLNYSRMVPAFETPIKNVFLANIQQVYPWDRGTNYSVELGEKAAEIVG
jgi:protoporphyrinogen oxidase